MRCPRHRRVTLRSSALRVLLDQAWQIEPIEAGLQAAEAEDLVCHERVREWLTSLGKDDEREPPALSGANPHPPRRPARPPSPGGLRHSHSLMFVCLAFPFVV